eukprot:11139815-Alexandrium_andersonii.AAC.1
MTTSKILPMGLYGAPAAPISGDALRSLARAIGKVIDRGAGSHRSLPLLLSLPWPREVDPEAWLWVLRVQTLRRVWFKQPELRECIDACWALARDRGHPACRGEQLGDWQHMSWSECDMPGPISL